MLTALILPENEITTNFLKMYIFMGGGPTPFLPMGKLCLFPIFPMGKNGEKSIWKEREMNTFPSFSIYFFGEMGKDTFFPWAKMGLDPPPPIHKLIYNKYP